MVTANFVRTAAAAAAAAFLVTALALKRSFRKSYLVHSKGVIIVSGASTGIGRSAAIALAAAGYDVFAGVRKAVDGESLKTEHCIHAISLDVTDAASIAAAKSVVQQFTIEHAVPLVAVINNAGIAKAGPVEYLSMEDVRATFNCNVIGAIALTQAFAPLIREHSSRIIFMSSAAGVVHMPPLSVYGASKAAINAMADALRIELAQFGVSVSTIIPGFIKTPIINKVLVGHAGLKSTCPGMNNVYPNKTELMVEWAARTALTTNATDAVIVHAVTSKHPKAEYFIGPDSAACIIMPRLPVRIADRLKLLAYNKK